MYSPRITCVAIQPYYRQPLPQHPHHGTFPVPSRPVTLSFRRQIVLVSLFASSPPPSALETDPARCLIVSRRKPISDGLRRALSGDSAVVAVFGGGPPSRSFAVAFDLFGEPLDLGFIAAVLDSVAWAPVAVFASDGNLYGL